MGRTVVLAGGHELREEYEQDDLPRHLCVRTGPPTRSNGYREHRGEIALH
jgi:hypothetical protein